MIAKILIWVGYSTMILCVVAVVAFAAIGLIGWAIAAACAAVLLGFICRIESNVEAWRNEREWRRAYDQRL